MGTDIRGRPANETGKGLWQMMTNPQDPELGRVLTEVAWQLGIDFAPLAVASPLKRVQEMRAKESAGQAAVGVFARSATPEDALWSALRLVRTQRIERGDFAALVRNRLRQDVENLKTAEGMVSREQSSRFRQGGATAEQRAAAEAGQLHRERRLNAIRSVINDAERVAPDWMTVADKAAILRGMNVNQADMISILGESNLPYLPARPDRRTLTLDAIYRMRDRGRRRD
jgi:hypothetical protein